ncbi:MAG: hypothetical protein Q4F29_12675, partial [Lachnospiraceae bacterium]|nr:hypothetical protein [Lachnospiraceae bacterium]
MDEWEEMEEWSGMRRREKAEANKEEKNGKRITALCSDRKGSSMVLVMCVLMAVLILCSALLLESASLASVVYRERSGERCRILAESVSRSLEKELVNRPYRWKMGTRSNAEAERSTYSNAKRLSGAGDGSLWEYVGTHIDSADGSWPDYDPESPDRYARSRARRTFRLSEEASGWPKEAGEVKVCLYWVK